MKVRAADSLQREMSKPSFTIRKGVGGGASKPFQIKKKVEEAAPSFDSNPVDPPPAPSVEKEVVD